MSQCFDVLIVGGGIVGLTAALAMAERDYTVAIIDGGSLKIDTSKADQRVYAMNKASQNILTELGVWQHLDAARVAPYDKMYVWDGVSGAHIDFNSRSVASSSLGTILEESVLKQALLQQIADQPTISLFPHSFVDEIHISDQEAKLSSTNKTWEGQLLMIADGPDSPTRKKLNIELTSWSYNQNALVARVQTEKIHQGTAYQVFNPDGPLAFLPLSDPNHCSIVWSTDPKRAQNLMTLDKEEFNNQLTQAFGGRLGAVTLLSDRYQFPLHMRHVKQYTGKRWLLLGDAAHTIHPLAGLGLNVGLADVRSWLNCLDSSNDILVSRKALGAYQRERKNEVWQIILLMEGFKMFFGYSLTPMTLLRGWGLSICNGIAPLKRLFIQHASGESLVPRQH
jgi:2-octaprenylphenol hydroxylase